MSKKTWPCGCIEGKLLCPEAERLWDEGSRAFDKWAKIRFSNRELEKTYNHLRSVYRMHFFKQGLTNFQRVVVAAFLRRRMGDEHDAQKCQKIQRRWAKVLNNVSWEVLVQRFPLPTRRRLM